MEQIKQPVGLKWYVVKAISGQEKVVQGHLERAVEKRNLGEYIVQALIPTTKYFEVRNGKKYAREKNNFPGYILVNADISRVEVIPVIMSIPSVLGFLGAESGASKKPIPLRPAEVNRILNNIDEANIAGVTETSDTYIVGESVKVVDESFDGFIGTVEEVFEEKKKLKVTVKIFGRDTPLELNYSQVTKVE
ncbi:MAG: transcription termination/antitermination factor NusG [Bacteroidetes bacterium]|nr:MAG: transcription termination/antitermination factor NusG [Bacteroidota bacterium]TAG87237.1 MAG: transcription termination/antitermination factor NusG [Bacteroidota bacterium]